MKQTNFIKLATAFLILFFGLLFSSWTMPDQKEHRKQKKLMILCGAYRVGQFGYKSSEDSIQQLYELKLLKEKLEQYKGIDDTAEFYFIIKTNIENRYLYCNIDNMGDSLLLVCYNDLPFANELFRNLDVGALDYGNNHYFRLTRYVKLTYETFLTSYLSDVLSHEEASSIFQAFRDSTEITRLNSATVFNPNAAYISWYVGDDHFIKYHCDSCVYSNDDKYTWYHKIYFTVTDGYWNELINQQ